MSAVSHQLNRQWIRVSRVTQSHVEKNSCVWGMGVGNNNPPHATAKKEKYLKYEKTRQAKLRKPSHSSSP